VQRNPPGEERIAFIGGSQLYGVNLFRKRAERLHKVEVGFVNIHGKCEKGYYCDLYVLTNKESTEVAA